MTLRRMDSVGIVVDDLKAAIAFLVEPGMEVEGEPTVEGEPDFVAHGSTKRSLPRRIASPKRICGCSSSHSASS